MLNPISQILLLAVGSYSGVLIAYIILSFLSVFGVRLPDGARPFASFLYDVCEPFLRLFRRLLPALGPIDISPMIGFILLQIVYGILARTLP